MKKNLLIGLFFLLSFCAVGLFAEESTENKVTLPDLIEVALQENLRIQAANVTRLMPAAMMRKGTAGIRKRDDV